MALSQFGANRTIAGTLVLMLFLGLLSMTNMAPAFAAPITQITVKWAANTPAQVDAGDVVTAEWRVNVNDDANPPTNAPVDNVTFTATATHGKFASIPDACLTTGVTPVSSISPDGMTLVCNLGTQIMGTAVAIQTPITAEGTTGDELSIAGSTADATAVPPNPIPINGFFGMDINWDSPGTWYEWNSNFSAVQIDYQWTLNVLAGSDSAGPNTVSYTLTLDPSLGGAASAPRCEPYTQNDASGHPFSGGSHPTDRMAPFVGSCELIATGTPNQFIMTLTGIDYSQTQVPTKDGAGRNLPVDRTAVASGRIVFQVPATANGSVGLNSSTPTYTAANGLTSTDDAANNTSSKTFVLPGAWASTYDRAYSGNPGGQWDFTFQASQGTTVQQHWHSELHPADPSTTIQQCTTIDTAYATYAEPADGWHYASLYDGPTFLPDNQFTRLYYVGNDPSLIAGSPTYNPEAFGANCDTDPANWTSILPADLGTIKAVRTVYTAAEVANIRGLIGSDYTTVKPDAPIGQDIWQFSSYKVGSGVWNNDSTDPINRTATPTPGTRYAYTSMYRDVLRVVGLTPALQKSVDRASVKVGAPATYTLNYSANGGAAAPPTTDGLVITDTLPVGMTYVASSASPAPVITTNGSGQQVLTWTLNGVTTNTLHALTYQAVAGADAVPGQTLTNTASASLDGQTTVPVTADVTVSANGLTTIGKTADEAFIPNVNGDGTGAGSWTVTLKSFDPTPQAFTDTIDILPYNGDGRGTSYSGSYALTGVTAIAGSTVYYTAADPATLNDDPADASNGAAGNTTGNTVGWTTVKPANPTAVRVIGPALAPGATQAFKVSIQTTGAIGGDILVNRAQARAEHTELVMRTSAPISVANYYSASLKKYVQDTSGAWHDANTVEDYPAFRTGDQVNYRIVVTNTGQGTLTNVVVADDKYPAEGGFTIASLAPGAEQTHEFTATLGDGVASTFVNMASATADTPPDSNVPPTIPPDNAGIEVANYTTVKTSDPATGSTVVPGQKVTYTVTVKQAGSVPAAASFTDDLTKVLDDADYNGDAVASTGNVSVAGSGLSWTGTVPVGGTATITYSVTVKTPPAGDQQLTNVVTSDGCVPVNGQTPDCTTTHPIGAYTVSKTSDPASTSTVREGDKVTYTVHVKQTGPGALTGVIATDDLSKVLDDAAFNNDAVASAGTATFDATAKTLVWNGDLPVGADITITYSVTVAPLGTGDGQIANVVTPTSPGGTCVTAVGCDTTHTTTGFEFSKTSDPANGSVVKAGDKVTYTVTVKQIGAGPFTGATLADDLSKVLDDAAFNNDAVASAGTATFDAASQKLNWTGDLTVGQTVTLTYSVTVGAVGAGDGAVTNVVTTANPGGTCVRAADQNPDCTTTVLKGGYTVEKSSDPLNGSTVKEGNKVTYTVTVKQTGPGALTGASISDDLSKVLDDATFNNDAAASAGTALFDAATQKLNWTGNLGVGAVVTITYSITIAPLGTGDGQIANVVTPTSPGGICNTAVGCNTTHWVSDLTVTKSVDPESGTTVSAGNKLTYTLTFKNTGTGPIDVDYTDLLTGVLDDAAVTAQPVASDGSLTASTVTEGAFTVKGTLAAGATVTLTYAVTVNPDGSRGDDLLENFVFKTGGNPAATCVTGDPLCTFNPITTPPAPPAGLANTGPLGTLAYTGANVLGFTILALFALLAGGTLLAYRRRANG
jgi:uncharacterized repeat protein (TIGR01451 family)